MFFSLTLSQLSCFDKGALQLKEERSDFGLRFENIVIRKHGSGSGRLAGCIASSGRKKRANTTWGLALPPSSSDPPFSYKAPLPQDLTTSPNSTISQGRGSQVFTHTIALKLQCKVIPNSLLQVNTSLQRAVSTPLTISLKSIPGDIAQL